MSENEIDLQVTNLNEQQPQPEQPAAEREEMGVAEKPAASSSLKEELKATERKALKRLKEIKANVSEEDQTPIGAQTLRKILGGDILSADLVRRQVWLFLLVVLFTVVYVAFRYQCQQDMIRIAQLENQLKDVKYKALSSSSTLTERCRESRVLEMLKQNKDSLLKISDQPPYIINIDE